MKLAVPLLVLAALAACAVALPEPDLEMAGGDAAVLDRLRAGRRLYIDKCSGCHSLHDPAAYSDRAWRVEVDEMVARKKVRLRDEEREGLLTYLAAANRRE